jgi:hypothetical protein
VGRKKDHPSVARGCVSGGKGVAGHGLRFIDCQFFVGRNSGSVERRNGKI